jgi:hypothetical protein
MQKAEDMRSTRRSSPKAKSRGSRKDAKKSKTAPRPRSKKARPLRTLVIGNEHIETPEAAGGEEMTPANARKGKPSSRKS